MCCCPWVSTGLYGSCLPFGSTNQWGKNLETTKLKSCVAAFCNETWKGFERSVKRNRFSHPLHPRKPFRDLLEDVARQLPRDVGEKTAWESTGQLASVLKKLNAQSLHPRLGTRLNNALLQADGVDHRDAVGGLGFGFV